tara:strand:- start:5388 stop:5606 length:219 start_codon:yes stop_codon:yes gene_type:complete
MSKAETKVRVECLIEGLKYAKEMLVSLEYVQDVRIARCVELWGYDAVKEAHDMGLITIYPGRLGEVVNLVPE